MNNLIPVTSIDMLGDLGQLVALSSEDNTATAFGSDSPPRVSIKNKVFRLIKDGSEMSAPVPGAMDFVIVDTNPHVSRTFYAAAWVEGSRDRPVCSSVDGITPLRTSEQPQHTNCAQCPHNQEGTGQNGRGRACRYSQTIAVCVPGDWANVYSMRIPAKSLFGGPQPNGASGLQHYARHLKMKRCTPSMLVTRFDWNHNEQLALIFAPVRALTPHEYQTVLSMQRTPEVLRAISMVEEPNDEHMPAPQYAQPAPAPQYAQPAPAPQYAQPAPDAAVPTRAPKKARSVQEPTDAVAPPVVRSSAGSVATEVDDIIADKLAQWSTDA